ncbi:MAG: hypothetical protein AB8B97_26405 [Granulosicoccus sp.]
MPAFSWVMAGCRVDAWRGSLWLKNGEVVFGLPPMLGDSDKTDSNWDCSRDGIFYGAASGRADSWIIHENA